MEFKHEPFIPVPRSALERLTQAFPLLMREEIYGEVRKYAFFTNSGTLTEITYLEDGSCPDFSPALQDELEQALRAHLVHGMGWEVDQQPGAFRVHFRREGVDTHFVHSNYETTVAALVAAALVAARQYCEEVESIGAERPLKVLRWRKPAGLSAPPEILWVPLLVACMVLLFMLIQNNGKERAERLYNHSLAAGCVRGDKFDCRRLEVRLNRD